MVLLRVECTQFPVSRTGGPAKMATAPATRPIAVECIDQARAGIDGVWPAPEPS